MSVRQTIPPRTGGAAEGVEPADAAEVGIGIKIGTGQETGTEIAREIETRIEEGRETGTGTGKGGLTEAAHVSAPGIIEADHGTETATDEAVAGLMSAGGGVVAGQERDTEEVDHKRTSTMGDREDSYVCDVCFSVLGSSSFTTALALINPCRSRHHRSRS